MPLPTLFKQRKNKTYGYQPRYYNERKERIENLEKKYHGTPNDQQKYVRKVSFRDEWKATRKTTAVKNTNTRTFLIFILLLIIAYLILEKYNIHLF